MSPLRAPLPLLALVGLLGLASLACGPAAEDGKTEVRLAYVNWAEGIAMTHLVEVILEERLGAEVELTMADVAPVFTAVATGQADAFLDAWLPVTHDDYFERYSDDFVDLGPNFEGARIGLVVPDYVELTAVPELAEHAEAFGGRIVGIDAGAGLMKKTEEALEAYGLELDLVASSGPAMTTALKAAIDDEEPVVVTGWRPHWKFARWDLRFLEDPEGVYGSTENIHTVVRKGLREEAPAVHAFLDAFHLDGPQLASLMDAVNRADDASAGARTWAEEHGELVEGWLAAVPREPATGAAGP